MAAEAARPRDAVVADPSDPSDQAGRTDRTGPGTVLALFDAQAQSRHLDFAARWLQSRAEGFYTIGSAGHEANAALGLLTRVDDPALLHYRSGGFYAARAARHAASLSPGQSATQPVRDVLLSLTSAVADPMSGGRHKVFGHPVLHIVPQTSTIGSHLPRAVGLAYTLGSLRGVQPDMPWPPEAIVVCSFGDASLNHSTAQGAFNAAAYLTHRGLAVPLLLVCEDNGIGISTRTPTGWTEQALRRLPGLGYVDAADPEPDRLLADVRRAVDTVRETRRPTVLHLRTVRFMGHAGSDVELGYRSRGEILADYERDPLLATAGYLARHGILSPEQVLERYESVGERVRSEAEAVLGERRLRDRAEVVRPLRTPAAPRPQSQVVAADRVTTWAGALPEAQGALTLAQAVNAALTDVMLAHPHAVVLGEDVAVKGGVYGVTRGLRKRFGGARVLDTLLDEQTILGTALGAALAGVLPLPEIQYLAYLHNAEDQLRGEAASLPFFSDGSYRNPMVVRIAGLAYQKGFGGHFHNDNSVAVLRDIPGLVLCVPSHPQDAPALLRECVALAERDGRVCVYLEPIALYHSRDLHEPGDGGWTATYPPPGDPSDRAGRLGTVRRHGTGTDLLMVTFGNGVPMALRAARRLEAEQVACTLLDLRWLAPLPVEELLAEARRFERILVVDETRAGGGVSEGVLAALVDAGDPPRLARVTSADSFVPLGPAAAHVLLSEDDIVREALLLLGPGPGQRTS
ncbi:MFS transporter [Nocardioides mesophilus]|uniref:MFS transporter n=1 Tax=Nocardioides mesophilus TaxID=433659 RepID=A0A7G9RHF4_9ACTN|nr:MFS transporter [Nocardioides mesophilus]